MIIFSYCRTNPNTIRQKGGVRMENTYIPHKMPELHQRANMYSNAETAHKKTHIGVQNEQQRERMPKPKPKSKKTGIRLMICITILALTLFLKTTFKDGYKKLSEDAIKILCGNVDYEEAVSCIGDALKGEVEISEALERAYTAVFGLKKDDGVYVSDMESNGDQTENNNTEDNKTEEITDDKEDSVDISPQSFTYWDAADDSVGEEYKTAVINVFTDSQKAYADISPPENVTYDFRDFDFDYICPVEGTVSSAFGYREHPNDGAVRFHYGTDIAAATGTDIVSFADGKVIAVGDSASYGMYILIEHEGGVRTQYSHCSEIYAKSGDSVIKGETVAAVGDTGNATGSCLHFEITDGDMYLNPEYYVSWT